MTRTYSDRSVAKRYDAARALPVETTRQWMAELKALLPGGRVRAVLDLGCGTGRFAGALRETFACPVVAIDPSVEMLEQATTRGLPGVEWRQGSAEETPLGDGTVDLVWMSQVFHHLDDLEGAMGEIRRVLSDDGILAIRNGTRENDAEIEWYRFFPEVREMDAGRIPSRQQIVDAVTAYGFRLLGQRTQYQGDDDGNPAEIYFYHPITDHTERYAHQYIAHTHPGSIGTDYGKDNNDGCQDGCGHRCDFYQLIAEK